MATQSISQDLADLLITKNFDPTFLDDSGRDSDPADAVTFSFNWTGPSGKNYGTLAIVLGDGNDLMVFFGDNLGRSMDDDNDKNAWFKFLEQLSNFATQHRYTFSPKDINRLKHTMAGIAAIKEGLFEGYYGTRKVSYMGEQTNARLVIKHNRTLDEDDKRYRYIESLFIETADGERFKLPFTKLAGGRAMLEHVRQGGKPYDIRGCHITEMVSEINLLSRFNRASYGRVFEGITQDLVENAKSYYQQLQHNIKHMSSNRGYREYFESWSPAEIGSQDALVEDIKTLFIEQTLDTRIESALPLLAKIQKQGTEMKEIKVFENWANQIAEGTWSLPDTAEQEEQLKKLMSQPLIAGPDGTNATEQLYDIVGDDHLFDLIGAAAEADPNANIWDIPEIVERLNELGVEVPTTAMADEQNPQSVSETSTVAGAVAPLEEGSSDYVGNAIEDLRISMPGLDREQFLDELYTYLDARYGKRAADAAMDHGDDSVYDEYYDNYSDLTEGTGVTDYAPKSQGGTRKELLARYHKTKNPKDAEAARKAGATQKELQGVAENLDNNEFHTSVPAGKFLPSKYGKEQYLYLHDTTRKSGTGSGPMLVTVDSLSAAKEIANEFGGRVVKTKMGTYRIVKDRQVAAEDSTDPMDHRGAVTDSFYEDLARLKKLAFVKRT